MRLLAVRGIGIGQLLGRRAAVGAHAPQSHGRRGTVIDPAVIAPRRAFDSDDAVATVVAAPPVTAIFLICAHTAVRIVPPPPCTNATKLPSGEKNGAPTSPPSTSVRDLARLEVAQHDGRVRVGLMYAQSRPSGDTGDGRVVLADEGGERDRQRKRRANRRCSGGVARVVDQTREARQRRDERRGSDPRANRGTAIGAEAESR